MDGPRAPVLQMGGEDWGMPPSGGGGPYVGLWQGHILDLPGPSLFRSAPLRLPFTLTVSMTVTTVGALSNLFSSVAAVNAITPARGAARASTTAMPVLPAIKADPSWWVAHGVDRHRL